jgi:dipeptidyl aminopeptidase/acylaminoacyl peptidase
MSKLRVLVFLAVLCGCGVCCTFTASRHINEQSSESKPVTPSESKPVLPDLGQGQRLEAGVIFHEVKLPRRGATNKLWVYLPEGQTQTKIPCVLIAPAGTRMFHGKTLGDGDRPEHLPYVRAGFAVVAYELDGPLADDASDAATIVAAQLFKKAEAGLVNARMAIDYALTKVPGIDPSRIYTAGHSSAGTTSLHLAEREPRVRACVAYAPVTNVEKSLGEDTVASLSSFMPDYREFLNRTSPHAGIENLVCPLFLFHAEDDGNVPIAESAEFAKEASKHNAAVTFVRVAKGGHYNAMLNEGITKAVQWLKTLKGAQ